MGRGQAFRRQLRVSLAALALAALGAGDAYGAAPVRVLGAITLRGRAVEVDDTLVYLVKSL